MLASNIALISLHDPALCGFLNRGDGGVAVNLGPARTRTLGQCLCQIRRLNIAVIRVLNGTQNAFDIA